MNSPLLQRSPWYCTLFLTAFLSETEDDSFRHAALQGNAVLVDGLLNGDHRKLGLFLARTLGILSYSFIHLSFIFYNSHLRM